MATDKAPAFSFYAKDFMLGTVTMSLAERGAYITLLAYQWDTGSVPDDAAARLRVLACSKREAVNAWTVIRHKFTQGADGLWRNDRLERERAKQQEYREQQSRKGQASARVRWQPEDNRAGNGSGNQTVTEPVTAVTNRLPPDCNSSFPSSFPSSEKKEREEKSLSPAAPSVVFTDDGITQRAGKFIRRYQVLYPEYRSGARYLGHEHRDYLAAVSLCEVWSDDRLEKLAVCFLTTNHKFAEEGSRTIPQLRALASWLDGELAKWEREQATGS